MIIYIEYLCIRNLITIIFYLNKRKINYFKNNKFFYIDTDFKTIIFLKFLQFFIPFKFNKISSVAAEEAPAFFNEFLKLFSIVLLIFPNPMLKPGSVNFLINLGLAATSSNVLPDRLPHVCRKETEAGPSQVQEDRR